MAVEFPPSSSLVALFLGLYTVSYLYNQANGCNVFEGNWVFDNSYPLYESSKCPFIEKEFDCLGYGRPDKLYLKYRWKPNACDLPKFNGQYFLQRFRGKKIMFVGDSLSLNQWQSLTCMLHTAQPQAKYTLVKQGGLSIFSFPEYKVSIMFLRNAFFVDIVGESKGRVLKLDYIGNGELWKSNDVLIFNSWHWWLHTGRKQPWDFIEYENKIYKDMNRLVAYEIGLTTWANWVNNNIDPTKTRVFFQGISPDHANARDWKEPTANACEAESQPLMGSKYPGGTHPATVVVNRVLSKMVKPVYLLDITTLSQLRKDGHPSHYGGSGQKGMDCSHWCLAGVPDTWNQLLYTALFQK